MQVAAIPFKYENDCLKILLLTTRKKRKWIVPKGWPVDGLSFNESAKKEAMEEAGVSGLISKAPIGDFIHNKTISRGQKTPCKVITYSLLVTDQLLDWDEKKERSRRWCSISKAAERVSNRGLSKMLRIISEDPSILSRLIEE